MDLTVTANYFYEIQDKVHDVQDKKIQAVNHAAGQVALKQKFFSLCCKSCETHYWYSIIL